MKFNHLNVPTHWQNYWTRYPEGHTILEALISWVSQVDSMADNVNSWNDYLDNFVATFDKELQQTVTETLSEWQNSGFIDVVVSEALQWELDNYKTTNEQDKASLSAQLQLTNSNKVDKNGSGQVGWANIAQDARLQIIGDTPPAVVGTNAVTTANITNNAVTSAKRTVTGDNAFITALDRPFNINTIQNTIELPENTFVFYQNKIIVLSTVAFTVPLTNGALLYNVDTNSLRCALPNTSLENELILGLTYKNAFKINGYFTVDGMSQSNNLNNIFGYIVHAATPINLNTQTDELILPSGNKYIFQGKSIIRLPNDEIKISLETGGFLYYDTKKESFGVGIPDDLLTPYSVMLGYISSRSFNEHFINSRYTIDGKQNFNAGTITKEMLDFDPLTEIPTLTVDSKWKGKKAVAFGDSITWYDGNPFGTAHKESGTIAKGYQSYMREQLQCTVDNKGASGQDLLAIADIIKAYDFTDTDFATLTSGANDERKGVPFGTLQTIGSSHNETTFIGALQSAIEYMINANKNMKIYLMTPIRGWYNTYNTPDVPNTDPNVVGMMTENYANAIKEVAALYGLPVLDWYNLTGLNELTKNDYLGDILSLPYYLHPTNDFYTMMASSLIPFLNNF